MTGAVDAIGSTAYHAVPLSAFLTGWNPSKNQSVFWETDGFFEKPKKPNKKKKEKENKNENINTKEKTKENEKEKEKNKDKEKVKEKKTKA